MLNPLPRLLRDLSALVSGPPVHGHGQDIEKGSHAGEGPVLDALLSPDILTHVFSFMSPEQVLYAAPVCSAW
jgi:hypothetical protein